MKFQKGVQNFDSEEAFTRNDIERIWEFFFGRRWSINHIAEESNVIPRRIIRAIDSESERRWQASQKAPNYPKGLHKPLTTHLTASIGTQRKSQARKTGRKAAS
jgi:hypothetical protein